MANCFPRARASLAVALLFTACGGAFGQEEAETPTLHGRGLHGYIGFEASRPEDPAEYGAGYGFYSAVWSLPDRPVRGFQIGLASAWIMPDNRDNKTTPLAPPGTLARTWPERGPTWSSVFQTVEGGLGYWAGNRFRYGPPKFSMNATPQAYDYEVGSPGWEFFRQSEALRDDRLGVAQLSNRLLIPPDGLPFAGAPNGEYFGYAYLALPFTAPVPADPETGAAPTGDQAWTCFVNAENFKGPVAYYIPETWSKIADVLEYPFLHGRGLDSRAGLARGGAMEVNTVPRFEATAADGVVYSKLPKLRFPVDENGEFRIVRDVRYYSKAALYDDFKAWRDGGPACDGQFDDAGAWEAKLSTRTPRFDLAGQPIVGVDRVIDTAVFDDGAWGVKWATDAPGEPGVFPQYYRHDGETCVAVPADATPVETGLRTAEFPTAPQREPYTSPTVGAWAEPGPASDPRTVALTDGSTVTYRWYRFVDQPSFQQYDWSEEKRANLQALVEKIHTAWTPDRDYLAPLSSGALVAFDPALLVTPPPGMEVGYVPIVTGQRATPPE